MTPILFSDAATTFSTQGIGALADALSCYVTEELNGQYELEMTYPVTGRRYKDIKNRLLIYCNPDPYRAAQPFRIYRITRPLNGVITIYARHISYDLSGIPISPYTAANLPAALQGLSQNAAVSCPFTFWTNKTSTGDFSAKVPTACRSLLGGSVGSILDTYGGEYEWDLFTVKLWNQRGSNNGVRIAYGKNLTDINQDENISNLVTGVIGYWTSTDGDVVQGPLVPAPGTYKFNNVATVDFSQDFEDPPTTQQLQQRTQKYIDDNDVGIPDVSISVSWVQLEQYSGYEDISLLERVSLGDTVTVEFPPLGVDATARVVKTKYDVLRNRYENAEIGRIKANIANTIANQQQEINQKPGSSQIAQIANAITQAILGAKGGAIRMLDTDGDGEPDTLYIADNVDPTKAVHVWRFNYMGWGASSHGYNGPFEISAALGIGLYADFITAGTLNAALVNVINLVADNIKSGTISSVDGQQLWNLDEGYFQSSGPAEGVPGRTYKTVLDASKLGFYTNGALVGTITGGVYTIAQNGYHDNSDGNKIAYYNSSGVTVNVFSGKIPKQRLQAVPGVIYTADEDGNLFNCNLSTGDFQLINNGIQFEADSGGLHFTNSSIDFDVNGDGILLNGKQWIRTSRTTTMMTFAADKNQPNYYLYYGITSNTAGGNDNVWTLCPFVGGNIQLGTQKQPFATSYIKNLYISGNLNVQSLYVYDANSNSYRKAVWKYQSAIGDSALCME